MDETFNISRIKFIMADSSVNLVDKEFFTDAEYAFSVDTGYVNSFELLEISKKINFFFCFILIIFGLAGNSLTIFVFAQKRFRRNSTNVFLLCLACNDIFYLMLHFVEDTMKMNKLFFPKLQIEFFALTVNLVNNNSIACKIMNYIRYVSRFFSAFTIVSFTVQRLMIIYIPLSDKFKTKSSAWITVSFNLIFSLLVNAWIPCMFGLKIDFNGENFCDVIPNWSDSFFHTTIAYVFLTLLGPIVIIFVCNLMIITRILVESHFHRQTKVKLKKCVKSPILKNVNLIKLDTHSAVNGPNRGKPYYMSMNQFIDRIAARANSPKKLTFMLMLISLSYACLNLPYLITWSLFYYYDVLKRNGQIVQYNFLYSLLKFTEIFYLLNYSINFYIYCASGSVFRTQLKYSSNFLF